IPGLRGEGWRAGFDDRMDPLGHGAIWFLHGGDRLKCSVFPCCLVLLRALFRFQFFGAISHRGFFLVRESLGLLGGAFTWVHKNLLLFKLLNYGLFLSFYSNVARAGVKMTGD